LYQPCGPTVREGMKIRFRILLLLVARLSTSLA
jgi:hypothetical protein